MSWNHRVIREIHEVGSERQLDYGVHEVFYGDDGSPSSWTKEPVAIFGDTFKGAAEVYMQMAGAFMLPILEVIGDKLVEVDEEWIKS